MSSFRLGGSRTARCFVERTQVGSFAHNPKRQGKVYLPRRECTTSGIIDFDRLFLTRSNDGHWSSASPNHNTREQLSALTYRQHEGAAVDLAISALLGRPKECAQAEYFDFWPIADTSTYLSTYSFGYGHRLQRISPNTAELGRQTACFFFNSRHSRRGDGRRPPGWAPAGGLRPVI